MISLYRNQKSTTDEGERSIYKINELPILWPNADELIKEKEALMNELRVSPRKTEAPASGMSVDCGSNRKDNV